ncbi:hypothetical protein B9N43_03490 [Denitratisoma sp. DHT3]|uniref:protein YgfX n=1 Tax=Denitratisoma sp. DHT3 TaxID=1981880 RepID=UPI0011985EE9|nr:protein YgfX [Denitratisoma sp. DHT3]QDX80406.1 hypothetical protein B9N43_03490 [Denitratisoma sp. DHT3]
MDLPVTLRLRPSATLAAVLLLGHGLAVAAVLPCELPLPAKWALIGLIGVSCAHSLWRHALHRGGVRALILRQDGKVDLIAGPSAGDGTAPTLEPDAETSVHVVGVVLRLRSDKRRLTLVLPPDALDAGCHRKLRVWLNWRTTAYN